MPLFIALVLSLAFHLVCYTLADWAGMRAQPMPKPRPIIEAMLIVPQMTPVPEVVPAEAQPEAQPPAAPVSPPLPPQPRPPVVAPTVAPSVPTAPPAPPAPPVAPSKSPQHPAPAPRPPDTTLVAKPPAPSPLSATEDKQTRFYPLEAVHRGLEGTVMVSVVIDAAGNVTAARLERGSGHAMLDEAAVRAARTLKNLPVEHHGEATLPVRFKLR